MTYFNYLGKSEEESGHGGPKCSLSPPSVCWMQACWERGQKWKALMHVGMQDTQRLGRCPHWRALKRLIDWKSETQGIHRHWNEEQSQWSQGLQHGEPGTPPITESQTQLRPGLQNNSVAQNCSCLRRWVETGNLFVFYWLIDCNHTMIFFFFFETAKENYLDSVSHQEVAQSRNENTKGPGGRKPQVQQLVSSCVSCGIWKWWLNSWGI